MIFRDQRLVTEIASEHNLLIITDSGCRAILSISEIFIRSLLRDIRQNSLSLGKFTLSQFDIEIALKDINCYELLKGSTIPKTDSTTEDIRELIRTKLSQNLFPKKKIELNIEWILPELKTKKDLMNGKLIDEMFEKPIDEDKEGLFIIKKLTPSLLTKETEEFFQKFISVIDDYFIDIDDPKSNILLSESKYQYGSFNSS